MFELVEYIVIGSIAGLSSMGIAYFIFQQGIAHRDRDQNVSHEYVKGYGAGYRKGVKDTLKSADKT